MFEIQDTAVTSCPVTLVEVALLFSNIGTCCPQLSIQTPPPVLLLGLHSTQNHSGWQRPPTFNPTPLCSLPHGSGSPPGTMTPPLPGQSVPIYHQSLRE